MSPINSTLANTSARGYGGLGNSSIAAGNFESIATYTATGTVGDITFNSIPSGYKILQIRHVIRDVSASSGDRSIFIQFNGDTSTSNYAYNRMYSYPGANSFGIDYNNTFGIAYAGITIADNTTPTNDYGANIIEIIDYANTSKTKQIRQYGGSSQSQFNSASLWTGTAAINSVKIYCSGGANIKIHSTAALYGIKG